MRHLTFIAFACALAGGCANQPGTTNVDRSFGQAVNAAKAAQVADPAAASRVRPAAGSDGEQARTAVEQYEKSYTHPAAPTSILNIGIGSGTGASAGASR